MSNINEACAAACADIGIAFKTVPADGCFHSTDIENDAHGRGDGRIKLFPDGEGGIVCNWKEGETKPFFVDDGKALNESERRERERKRKEEIRKAKEEEAARHKEAAIKAAVIWDAAPAATDEHAYLVRKAVNAHGTRLYEGALVISVRDGKELHSLQFIDAEGNKRFLSGGRVAECYFGIGKAPAKGEHLLVCEGFATGASLHEATGFATVIAFFAGNLAPVAKAMRKKYPEAKIVLCADNDAGTASNPGITKAAEAAKAVGGLLAIPDFGADGQEGKTDFNDLARAKGMEAVKACIEAARAPVAKAEITGAAASDSEGWPEPQSLALKVEPEPYPTDALPDSIRAAVEEVQAFTKAPISMVASSALAALSLAAQAHIDAKRAERLQGPVGLFLLTIADSGERKSTCEEIFTSAIREYQEQQAEATKPAVKEFRAKLEAWDAKHGGIKEKIRHLAKDGKPTIEQEAALRTLEDEKPEAPRVPRLLRGDDTPENLAWVMSREWPSAGVLSSEAGVVLGAHGMGNDSIMRNLALLNILWDGGTLAVGRRTSESFTVQGVRMTMALQVQELTLRSFFKRSGNLARGTGFLARFLVAWPESTQGFRPFTEAPPNWPHLATFNRRIAEILANPIPMAEDGTLSPALMMLAPEAKAAWVAFHDAIEGELASGGELYDVRDVASKSADNAARLGALFQIFEHGMGGAIGLECFESASRIAAWHLNESRRFFGELALPVELADAARLDTWLMAYCKRERTNLVPIAKLQQGGPSGLRSKATSEDAMRELEDAGRAKWKKDGKRKMIAVNPALLAEGGAS